MTIWPSYPFLLSRCHNTGLSLYLEGRGVKLGWEDNVKEREQAELILCMSVNFQKAFNLCLSHQGSMPLFETTKWLKYRVFTWSPLLRLHLFQVAFSLDYFLFFRSSVYSWPPKKTYLGGRLTWAFCDSYIASEFFSSDSKRECYESMWGSSWDSRGLEQVCPPSSSCKRKWNFIISQPLQHSNQGERVLLTKFSSRPNGIQWKE